jgi:hypothetical protein
LRHREGSLFPLNIKVAFTGQILPNKFIIALDLRLPKDFYKLFRCREGPENLHKPVPTPLVSSHVERRLSNPICSVEHHLLGALSRYFPYWEA